MSFLKLFGLLRLKGEVFDFHFPFDLELFFDQFDSFFFICLLVFFIEKVLDFVFEYRGDLFLLLILQVVFVIEVDKFVVVFDFLFDILGHLWVDNFIYWLMVGLRNWLVRDSELELIKLVYWLIKLSSINLVQILISSHSWAPLTNRSPKRPNKKSRLIKFHASILSSPMPSSAHSKTRGTTFRSLSPLATSLPTTSGKRA